MAATATSAVEQFFSKVSSRVVLCGELSSELTFENFHLQDHHQLPRLEPRKVPLLGLGQPQLCSCLKRVDCLFFCLSRWPALTVQRTDVRMVGGGTPTWSALQSKCREESGISQVRNLAFSVLVSRSRARTFALSRASSFSFLVPSLSFCSLSPLPSRSLSFSLSLSLSLFFALSLDIQCGLHIA